MPTTLIRKIVADSDVEEAVQLGINALRAGEVVAFPTETVYGVGVRADKPEAVARLRQIKQRNDEKPFTVHVGRPSQAPHFVAKLSGIGQRLIERAWPGPLTLIIEGIEHEATPVVKKFGPSVTQALYYEGSIGLRCPSHALASEMLWGVGLPIVAASANLAGQRPPRDGEDVLADLDGQIDLLIDTGPTQYAMASTIVRLNGQGFEIVREGVYDERTLRRLSMKTVLLVCSGNTCRSPMAAAVMTKLLAEASGVEPGQLETSGIRVISAGTFAMPGTSAADHAVEVSRDIGIDIADHRSQPLSEEIIRQADHIYTMTAAHKAEVDRMVPEASGRSACLIGGGGIEDPIGGSLETYIRCAEQIRSALLIRVKEVLA